MAASVLGKRSRRIEETEAQVASTSQPPRKRAARRLTPVIFEDARDVQTYLPEQNGSASRSVRSVSKSRLTVNRNECLSDYSTGQDVNQSYLAESVETSDNENRPPQEANGATPSAQRFKDISIFSPSTPKHKIRAFRGPFTPRTCQTIETNRESRQNIYARARQLFGQSSLPTRLVGRENERQQLRSFISHASQARLGGCTYISGPPGTGKSALVQEVLHEFESDKDIQVSSVNCVTLRSPSQIYEKVLADLAPERTPTKASAEAQLGRLLTSQSTRLTYVVVLDEIDSLVDEECQILYKLFDWALQPGKSLLLIGIANALDLTDRFLPRLKARGSAPILLPFLPYTAQQISSIITDKLRTLLPQETTSRDFIPCLHPSAIQLCGKKIASQTGDLRKAFALVRRCLDQVEKETLAREEQTNVAERVLGEITNAAKQVFSWSSKPSLVELAAEDAPRATIAHVVKLASSIFNNSTVSRLANLNLQQRIVLCSLIKKESKRQNRDPFTTPTKSVNVASTVRELYYAYSSLCRRDEGLLQPLKDTEFRDVVASLETLGLVHESRSRSSSLLTPTSSSSRSTSYRNDERQMVSTVGEKEMRESLSGPGTDLLQRLLDEA